MGILKVITNTNNWYSVSKFRVLVRVMEIRGFSLNKI